MLREHSGVLADTSYLNGLTSIGQQQLGVWSYYGTDALGSVRNTFTLSTKSVHPHFM
ncbi:MAG: hypothetical protein RIC84_28160 [Aggregatilineales bacterium]